MKSAERISACVAAARALEAALSAELQPIPKGWFSRRMFQEENGISLYQAKDQIQKLKMRNMVEVRQWRVETGSIPIYRLLAR